MYEKKKARFVDVILELGIGCLLAAIIIGKVAMPQIVAVSTTGWDPYTILVWGVFPLVVVSAMLMAIIYHVKYGAWPVR